MYQAGPEAQTGSTGTYQLGDYARPNAYIGRSCYGTADSWNGFIGEFAIYGHILTADRVAAHYAASGSTVLSPPPPAPPPAPACSSGPMYRAAVLADNPWAWWRLAETSGSVAYDCSVNGSHAGTYVGGASLAGSGRTSGAAALVAPKFDGSSGYVSLPTTMIGGLGGPFASSGYSIEAWVSLTTTALSANRFIAGFGNGQSSDNLIMLLDTAGHLYNILYVYGNSYSVPCSSFTIPANSWHHVVATVIWLPPSESFGAYFTLALYYDGQICNAGDIGD